MNILKAINFYCVSMDNNPCGMQINYLRHDKRVSETDLQHGTITNIIGTPPSSVSSEEYTLIQEHNAQLLRRIAQLEAGGKSYGKKKRHEKEANTHKEIMNKVKNDIFRHIKFVTSDFFLNDLRSEYSLGRVLLQMYNIEPEEEIQWWNIYKHSAKEALNAKRSTVNTEIMKEVMKMFDDTDELDSARGQEGSNKRRMTQKKPKAKKNKVLNGRGKKSNGIRLLYSDDEKSQEDSTTEDEDSDRENDMEPSSNKTKTTRVKGCARVYFDNYCCMKLQECI